MRIDLHTHSAVSDGTDSPSELVAHAVEAGLDAVALTDHDTFDGLPEASAAAERLGIDLLPGLEMSCQRWGDSVHLLGYGCDQADTDLLAELTRLRGGRDGRLDAMVTALNDVGIMITRTDVLARAGAATSIGRPHVADAMIAAGYVPDRDTAFRDYLSEGRPGYVHRYACPVERGIDLVHAAGGVAVLAHPWGRGREHVLPPTFLRALVDDHGLDGIEVDHQDHDQPTRERLRALASDLGVLATGSSDYHGTGKVNHDLGVNITAEPVYRALLARLR